MKTIKHIALLLFISAAVFAQTEDLGQSVFYNSEGAIALAIDAGLAVRKLDSPYVMFMLFMASQVKSNLSVQRDDIVMIYKGQEYKMPSLEEWRKDYKGAQNDIEFYARLGKESLASSKMRFYNFNWAYDFYPVLGRGPLPADELSMANNIGAKTKIYFKNPGFQKGDELIIKVKDHKNPEYNGFCAVILK
jgi:hypothetical protein